MAINQHRKTAIQKIEQTIYMFQQHLLKPQGEQLDLLPNRLYKYMAFGDATFCSQNLQLGPFASPDYRGSSMRSLRDGISSWQSVGGFVIACPPPGCQNLNIQGTTWDLKCPLQNAITKLKMDEWGLNMDDFRPESKIAWSRSPQCVTD